MHQDLERGVPIPAPATDSDNLPTPSTTQNLLNSPVSPPVDPDTLQLVLHSAAPLTQSPPKRMSLWDQLTWPEYVKIEHCNGSFTITPFVGRPIERTSGKICDANAVLSEINNDTCDSPDPSGISNTWDKALVDELARSIFKNREYMSLEYVPTGHVRKRSKGSEQAGEWNYNAMQLLGYVLSLNPEPNHSLHRAFIRSVKYIIEGLQAGVIHDYSQFVGDMDPKPTGSRGNVHEPSIDPPTFYKLVGFFLFAHFRRIDHQYLFDCSYEEIYMLRQTSWVFQLSKHFGITGKDASEINHHNDLLYAVTASTLKQEFDIQFTQDPSKHLRFTKRQNKSTLLMLDLSIVFKNVYPLHTTGILRCQYICFALIIRTAGMPTLFREYMCSYVVLFGLDRTSGKIGEKLGIPMEVVRQFHNEYASTDEHLTLASFPILRPQFILLQRRLNFIQKSGNTFSFCNSLMVLVNLLVLGLSLAQTYAAYKIKQS